MWYPTSYWSWNTYLRIRSLPKCENFNLTLLESIRETVITQSIFCYWKWGAIVSGSLIYASDVIVFCTHQIAKLLIWLFKGVAGRRISLDSYFFNELDWKRFEVSRANLGYRLINFSQNQSSKFSKKNVSGMRGWFRDEVRITIIMSQTHYNSVLIVCIELYTEE